MGFNPIKSLNSFWGDPLGIDAAASATKANEKNVAKIGSLYDSATKSGVEGYGAALQTQRLATQETRAGVQRGRQALATAGNSARRSVLDQQDRTLAADEVNQYGRGFSSPALMSAARRASAYDTSTALDSIDEAIGNLLSSFELNASGAVAGSLGKEAGIKMGGTSALGDLSSSYASTLGGIQHTSSGGWLKDILPLAALGGG